ncbi:helix-turn-helix transcriptional regulator [Hydrogenophaga palleronii]|uniref:helix-turn-helix transcriptional regulator n=1 Tax=Hydrogenophaga palleronii TaxID=65655 RepID=UPI0014710E29|nr:helix-turn-helix transcriptional regulator [Hydrogenophaga palleronii]
MDGALAPNDLWVERAMALKPSGVFVSQQLLERSDYVRSGFYQDWNRPLGILHMVGSVFPMAGERTGVIGIHRGHAGAEFGAAERRRLAHVLPHLQRALRVRSQLAGAANARTAELAALDRLRTPALLLDGAGRLLHASALGEAHLRRGTDLSLCAGRVVAGPAFASLWRHLLEQAARGIGGAMRLNDMPGAAVTALLTPWRGAPDATPAVLVLLRDALQQKASIEVLRQLFGLTPSEARVAAAIAEGVAPEEIAERLGVSTGTVRSHLKQALGKTGTHRQNELAALVNHSVAMLG